MSYGFFVICSIFCFSAVIAYAFGHILWASLAPIFASALYLLVTEPARNYEISFWFLFMGSIVLLPVGTIGAFIGGAFSPKRKIAKEKV